MVIAARYGNDQIRCCTSLVAKRGPILCCTADLRKMVEGSHCMHVEAELSMVTLAVTNVLLPDEPMS